MRTAFVAVALMGCFVAFARAEDEHHSLEIKRNSYAAIAYSPSTGKYEYACDLRSRSAAEKAALEKCGAEDATVACWVNYGFCALALGSDKSCWGVGWEYGGGANNQRAKQKAIDDYKDCKSGTTGVQVVLMISSDGGYVWDQRDHITIMDKNGNVYDGYGKPITPTPSASTSANAEKSPPRETNPSSSSAGTPQPKMNPAKSEGTPVPKMNPWPPDDKK